MARHRFRLGSPGEFLSLLKRPPLRVDLGDVEVAEVWALVGLAVLARKNGTPNLDIAFDPASPASRFAHALGLSEVIEGTKTAQAEEKARSAPLRRVARLSDVEPTAREIAALLVPESEDDDSRKTAVYVLVELIRNAIQHSGDPKGGVVAAQLMNAGYANYPCPVVQVAVGDAGMGLPAALRKQYPAYADPEAAVVKALEPHVSGAFREGLTGSAYNAGMGLFMLSEFAKLTAGRMLLATRGAALWLFGDLKDVETHTLRFLRGLEFPGTLVAFELPLGQPADHDGMVEVVVERAKERTPRRDTAAWVRFESAPPDTSAFLVSMLGEDVEKAVAMSRENIQPSLFARKPVALDFRNMDVCTQSFLHALLFEAIRLSWATQTPVYIENAAPGIQTGVRLVDNYARGG